jgi:hypothetical protein
MEQGKTHERLYVTFHVELRLADGRKTFPSGWWWKTIADTQEEAEELVRKDVDEVGGAVIAGRVVKVSLPFDGRGYSLGPAHNEVVYNYRKGGAR